RASVAAPEPKRFQIVLPDVRDVGRFAVSPDGHWLAFTAVSADGRRRLWVRAIDSLEAHSLRGTEGADVAPPFWSPDSRFIAFGSARQLKKINISCGPPQFICDLPPQALGGSLNRGGVIISRTRGPLIRASPS